MKYIYTILLVVLISFSFIRSQVPNGGFENWTAGEPDFWTTNNDDTLITISQSSDAHSGSSALNGKAINYLPPFLPVMGPILLCEGTDGNGFPITARFNSLKGFYKFNPQGGDQLYISVYLSQDTMGIGAGAILLNGASSYTEFGVPIAFVNPGTPNLCYIVIEMINPVGGIIATLGSEMYIDDLELSMDIVSDVKDEFQPIAFKLEQNYPNPFNPSTRIKYQVSSSSQVTLKVYDILGNEVATLVNEEKPAGSYEVDFSVGRDSSPAIASGIYFYQLTSGALVQTRKMILVK